MRVVITDRKYPGEDNFSDVVTAAGGEVVFGDFETREELIEGCREADIIVSGGMPVTRDVIEAMGDGELILKLTTGYDNVDVHAATEHGIPVSNIPVYCTEEVAEHAITLMFAASRQIVANDQSIRSGTGWNHRGRLRSILGNTFGVVGFGRIGRTAAQLASALGMEVIAVDPYVPDDIFEAFDVRRGDLATVIADADCVSLHTPLTKETYHMLGYREFVAMKDTAVVVNTARGQVLDVDALVDAIKEGEIWGAGLDVFEEEPPTDSALLDTDRIVFSPHHAGRPPHTKQRLLDYARDKLDRVLRGEHHGEIVNPEVYNVTPDDS